MALIVIFLKTIQISLTVDFYFFEINKNMAEPTFKNVTQRMAKRKVLNGNNPKSPKFIANGQKKNVFQKILGSVLVLADYPNEKSC